MSWKLVSQILAIFAYLENASHTEVTEVVQTQYGPVRGNILTTVQKECKYSSFKGIPYARPPIGKYRFQPPEPPLPWTDTIYADKDPTPCAQIDVNLNYFGTEDCLYLNVYTPELNFTNFQLRAVMVWMLGGAYWQCINNSSHYGPDFLIEEEVVIVSMNYRVGALGFLSFANEIISGNAGIKDHVFVLEWVKENIERFGGDPKNVTIFGISSGAAVVDLLHLSPLSKGLFRASIAMSGAVLNPWAINSREMAVEFSTNAIKTIIKNFNPNSTKDIAKLFSVPTESLARLTVVTKVPNSVRIVFAPTIEVLGKHNRPFLTKDILSTYKSGNFIHTPHILGYVKNEIIGLLTTLQKQGFSINQTSERQVSYDSFIKGINRTRELLINSSSSPVYYYRNQFYYPEALHNNDLPTPRLGAGHGDDIAEIFYVQNANQSLDSDTNLARFRNKMVTMWTNFAKYLDPTAVLKNGLTVKWPETDERGLLLEMGDTFEVVPESIVDDE